MTFFDLFRNTRTGDERQAPELDDLLARSESGPMVLFKHSMTCGTSYWAQREVRSFESDTEVPVIEIVVQQSRALSDEIARTLDVRHASPQVLVLHRRRSVWDASHGRISAAAIRTVLNDLQS